MQTDSSRIPVNRKLLTDIFSRILIHPDVQHEGSLCWLWIGNRFKTGYAAYLFRGNNRRAHRVIFGVFVHEITDGRHADHLCRRPQCVNPIHVEDVTPRENTERGNAPSAKNMRTTHCPKGHPYSLENTRHKSTKLKNGQRACRTCEHTQRVARWHLKYPSAAYRPGRFTT